MEEKKENTSKLERLLKALGQIMNINPSIRSPNMVTASVRKLSVAPTIKKNPIKQAEQLQNTDAKKFAMQAARSQVASQSNKLAYKSEDGKEMFYAFDGEERLSNEPMTEQDIHDKWGKDIKLVPISQEKLKINKNGQWDIV
jgi:hypothetical protein